jgi:hypothetical protein
VKTEGKRTCQVCGAVIAAEGEVCPVCALRGALGDATSELPLESTPSPTEFRFGHYKVLTGEDGKLFELGRGSMGVTLQSV